MAVQRAEARRVRRPFVFTNQFLAVGSNPVLIQLCYVRRRAVVVVSAGDCFDDGRGKMYFIPDKAKVNAKIETVSAETCSRGFLPSGFIFQQHVALIIACTIKNLA